MTEDYNQFNVGRQLRQPWFRSRSNESRLTPNIGLEKRSFQLLGSNPSLPRQVVSP